MSIIIDASELAGYMSKTLDATLAQDVVDGVNAFVENQTHRCWGETKAITERYDWAPNIYLRHMDVQAITSLKLGFPGMTQYTLASNSYWFNYKGRVTLFWYNLRRFNPGPFNNDYIEIAYTYGVDNVPPDLKLAALGIAAGYYNFSKNGNKDVIRSNVGSYMVEFSGARRNQKNDPSISTEDRNWAVIKSYALQRV